MRRITLLFVALILALWGFLVMRAGEPSLPVALRDGLLITTCGAILFAAVAFIPIFSHRPQAYRSWATAPKIFLILGSLLTLAAGAAIFLALRTESSDAMILWALPAWGIGLLGLTLTALWPQQRAKQRQGSAWSVATAKQFLDEASQPQARPTSAEVGHAPLMVTLLLLTVLAAVLRIWNFADLPDSCGAATCEAGVQAIDFLRQDNWRVLLSGDAPVYMLLLALVFGLFEPGISSLRWVGLILGVLTVPLFYWAGSRLVHPATALVGTLLLVFAPWHIELSRYPEPGTLLLAGIFATVWSYGWATQRESTQGWILAGLLAGFTTLMMPTLFAPILILWWVVALPPAPWRGRLLYWLAILAGSAPRLATLPYTFMFPDWSSAVVGKLQAFATLFVLDAPFSTLFFGLLALLGLAVLLRSLRRWPARLLWLGVLLMATFTLSTNIALTWSMLAPILAIFSLSALVALDQLVGGLVQVWSPAIQPARLLAAAAAVLLLLLGIGTVTGLTTLADSANFAAVRDDAGTDVGQYLRAAFETSVDNGGDNPDLFFVPQDLLNAPSLQLAAGGVLPFARRILSLDPLEHLPFVGPPFTDLPTDGDLHYVIPSTDPVLLNRVTGIYSGFTADVISDESSGQALAYILTVPREIADTVRGLPVRYFSGSERGSEDEAVVIEQTGPLDFDWGSDSPLPTPFYLEAQGALYVPESGLYTFRSETEPEAQVYMELGQAPQESVLIDTGTSLIESQVELSQGYYPLQLRYISNGASPRLSVRWQRPGGKMEPIPQQALYTINAENGLLATYYAVDVDLADLATAAPIVRRREPLLALGPLAMEAGSVIWQAKLAAPVDGIYELGVEANGRYQLFVDEILLLGEDSMVNSRRATTLQLRYGWHDLTIQYQAQPGVPQFRLRWQPSGVQGGPIPAQYFAPYPPGVDTDELAVPEAPAAALVTVQPPGGSLSTPPALQASTEPLPGNLPELPLELLWRVDGCGAADTQFQDPRGVVIMPDLEQLYVADSGNTRLVAYDLVSGTPSGVFQDERLLEPFDLGRNALGEIFLLDAVAQQIYQYDPTAKTLTSVAQETTFYRPRGLGVDIAGTLLVADTGGGRVVILAPDGSVLTQLGGPDTPLGEGQPVDVISLPNGAIWAVTAEDGRLWRLDRGEGQAATAPSNTFSAPHLAGLSNSSFFITDPERRLITYYNADGQAAAQFSNVEFAKPVGIDAISVDGNLLLAVTDSVSCSLSLWQSPLDALP